MTICRDRYASIRHAADPSRSIAVALPAERELSRRGAQLLTTPESQREHSPSSELTVGVGRAQEPALEPVEVSDSVERFRGILGPERSEALAESVREHAQAAVQRSDVDLAQDRTDAEPALAALDGAGAYEARRLQQAADRATQREREATSQARQLEDQAAQLGWRQRRERGALLAEAHVHRQSAAIADQELENVRSASQRLRDEGRDPDEWFARHAASAAAGLAAERELEARRERSIQAKAEQAIQESGRHVSESIGQRPDRGGEQRERWDELARDLEAHRLRYEIDAERDGALGPDDRGRAGGEYQRERQQLARRVEEMRADQGLEAARETEPPELGLDA